MIASLKGRVTTVEENAEAVRAYTDVAFRDFRGWRWGAGVTLSDQYTNWCGHFARARGTSVSWKCSERALSTYEQAARRLPRYPWPLYFLAKCEQLHGAPLWHEHAEEALQHARGCMKIEGHAPSYDTIAADLSEMH